MLYQWKEEQEAQLPQRNSASAAHMKGLGPPAHFLAALSGYTYVYVYGRMIESETRNKRTSTVLPTKRTLR